MSKENKSFRLNLGKQEAFGDVTSKEWWKFKKMSRKEYGKAALTCMLVGFIFPPLFIVGVILGIIWIYKTLSKKKELDSLEDSFKTPAFEKRLVDHLTNIGQIPKE